MNETPSPHEGTCPVPLQSHPTVQLAHGGGGKLMHQLIESLFLPAFSNELIERRHDSAVFNAGDTRLAFTTDSYVIQPIFFPGGDIGSLAVNGTVNDLAMCGARPLYLSCGMIIEEGFPMEDLCRIAASMRRAADRAGAALVTGDTKVVDKGNGDGIFINTAGIGILEHDADISPQSISDGDVLIVSNDLGRHGTAIMAHREGLEFESTITSDCACLAHIVADLLNQGIEIHALRDLTRGGLGSALVEFAEASSLHLHINSQNLPVQDEVRGACEILGLDPLYIANEGCMLVIVPEKDADKTLTCLKSHPESQSAAAIGKVSSDRQGLVTLTSDVGTVRVVDMLSGEQLPRIC